MKKNSIKKKKLISMSIFGFVLILLGSFFQIKGIGLDFLSPTWTLGSWLIYVGIVSFFIVIVKSFRKEEKLVDERMKYIAMKASKVTFLGVLFGAFIIMIIDGINKITIPYSLFMSYFVCGIVLLYLISYKVLERRN